LVTKVIDYLWDNLVEKKGLEPFARSNREESERLGYTPPASGAGVAGPVEGRFGKYNFEARPQGEANTFFIFHPALLEAMRRYQIEPSRLFLQWGSPTSTGLMRPTKDGGEIGGQWFDQPKHRFVVIRRFGGDRVAMLPCEGGYADIAYRVAIEGDIGMRKMGP